MNEDHILSECFLPPLEHPLHKVGDIVTIKWDGEIAWAHIEGIGEKAGQLIYNVKVWTLAGIELYGLGFETTIETWIFPDMITKVN